MTKYSQFLRKNSNRLRDFQGNIGHRFHLEDAENDVSFGLEG